MSYWKEYTGERTSETRLIAGTTYTRSEHWVLIPWQEWEAMSWYPFTTFPQERIWTCCTTKYHYDLFNGLLNCRKAHSLEEDDHFRMCSGLQRCPRRGCPCEFDFALRDLGFSGVGAVLTTWMIGDGER